MRMTIILLMLYAWDVISIKNTSKGIEHFIIQATFPEGCGTSYLIKKNIFEYVKEAILNNKQCDCFKERIEFVFGYKDEQESIPVINDKEEYGWGGEFNFLLYLKAQGTEGYQRKLIGTSLQSDPKNFYNYLYDGMNEDKITSDFIDTLCLYCQ